MTIKLSCAGCAVWCQEWKLSDRMILSHSVPVLASHTCCAPLSFCFSLLTVQIIPPQKILSLKYWILINPPSPLFVSFNSCLISYGKPPFCFLHIFLSFIIYLHHVSFSSLLFLPTSLLSSFLSLPFYSYSLFSHSLFVHLFLSPFSLY